MLRSSSWFPSSCSSFSQDAGDLLLGGRNLVQLSPWGRAKRHADRIGWPPWNRQRRLSQVVKRLLERGKRYLGRSWKILEGMIWFDMIITHGIHMVTFGRFWTFFKRRSLKIIQKDPACSLKTMGVLQFLSTSLFLACLYIVRKKAVFMDGHPATKKLSCRSIPRLEMVAICLELRYPSWPIHPDQIRWRFAQDVATATGRRLISWAHQSRADPVTSPWFDFRELIHRDGRIRQEMWLDRDHQGVRDRDFPAVRPRRRPEKESLMAGWVRNPRRLGL
jgi:hypothetical protein